MSDEEQNGAGCQAAVGIALALVLLLVVGVLTFMYFVPFSSIHRP